METRDTFQYPNRVFMFSAATVCYTSSVRNEDVALFHHTVCLHPINVAT